jgi:hypothetical protein
METTTESQNKRIRKYLETGRSLTGMEALYLFGCWRLPARVDDLKKQGVKFEPTEMIKITSPSVFHGEKRVGKYKLAK